MLCLKVESQPSWIERAATDIDGVLADHAHCEKKAAVNAISMLNRYPGRERLVREMVALAQEELEHFERVYSLIVARGGVLPRDSGDPYVQALHREIRNSEPQRLLDSLLVAALVEARSCERFSILSRSIADDQLKSFYAELLASEAGHYRTFFDIACEYFDAREVRERLEDLSIREGDIVMSLQSDPTMHG